MTLDFGYLITFVLTAFSIIATVFAFLTPSATSNQSSDTFRYRALDTLLHNGSKPGNKLLAEETLHEEQQDFLPGTAGISKNESCDEKQTDPNVCIAYADMNYNHKPTSIQIPSSLNQAEETCRKKNDSLCTGMSWYTHRLFNLNKPVSDDLIEDATCKETGWKCTQEELHNITRNISNLSQIGYTSIFDNNANVLGLGMMVDNFIYYLNAFIIVAFITGPVVFIVGIKTMGKQES